MAGKQLCCKNEWVDQVFTKTEEMLAYQTQAWGIRGNAFMSHYFNSLNEMTKYFHKMYDNHCKA